MKAITYLTLAGMILLAAGGCAKLPLNNSAPAAPELASDGYWSNIGVEIQVTVDDPDADRVTLHFQATSSTGGVQDFAWTSFIPSGEQESFYLNLSVGQWTVTARARDEMDEQSPVATLDLTVVYP